jgi:hypothetical protein
MASSLRPGTVDRGRLPVQQRDRRTALSALALLLVVAGALGSALVVYRSGHRTDVLVASREIKPGQLITADDFTIARVANDGGAVIPATSKATFLGTHALSDIPAGTLLAPKMFLSGPVIPADGVVVGVTVSVTRRPAVGLTEGELVRVYFVAKDDLSTGSGAGAAVPSAVPPAAAAAPTTGTFDGARVLVDTAKVIEAPLGAASGGDLTISLLLKPADAQKVVLADADGDIALGRLPVTGTPAIDLQAPATTAPTPAA